MLNQIRLAILACAVGACTKMPVSANPPDTSLPPGSGQSSVGTQEGDWQAIVKLEDAAKAIAKISGCTSAECRAAPVGSRACGGPRYYIPYCSVTTDSAALYKKLGEVAAAERAYNTRYKVVSTCEFRMPPTIESVAGSCVAK